MRVTASLFERMLYESSRNSSICNWQLSVSQVTIFLVILDINGIHDSPHRAHFNFSKTISKLFKLPLETESKRREKYVAGRTSGKWIPIRSICWVQFWLRSRKRNLNRRNITNGTNHSSVTSHARKFSGANFNDFLEPKPKRKYSWCYNHTDSPAKKI